MYFSDNPSDRYYERMMVGVPNFKPRGHGVVIVGSRPTEPLVILRIQDGTATHREILTETTKAINHRRFRHRLNKYLKESEMNPMRYKNEKHQSEFEEAIRKKDKKDYAMMAALYLLTADLRLWNLSKRHVGKISINFADIRLKNIHENGYALFCCAKDLCLGTKHLTVADLADTDLIPPKLFELICNAMAIRRFGLGAIKTTERTNNQYLGKEPYPAILDEMTYTAMQRVKESRNTQKDTNRKTDIFQITVPVKCPICGQRMQRRHDSRYKVQQRWICENEECRTLIKIADSDLLESINNVLAGILPERIQLIDAIESEPSISVRLVNNEIARLYDTAEIDKETLRKKLLEGISKRYEDIDNKPYATRKLQVELMRDQSTDNVQRINKTVSEIILYTDLTVGITLLNGQFIGKEHTNGTTADG